MGSLFILSTVSFVMQKLLNLIRQVPLAFFFFLLLFALRDGSKNQLLQFMSKSVLPV